METTLAILMVLGIFVVIPLAVGVAVVGTGILTERRALRAKRAKALGEAVAEAPAEQPVEALGEAVAEAHAEEPAHELAEVK